MILYLRLFGSGLITRAVRPNLTCVRARCTHSAARPYARGIRSSVAPKTKRRVRPDSTAKFLGRLEQRGILPVLREEDTIWMQLKGVSEQDIRQWLTILRCETADQALPYIDEGMPVYLLVKTIRSTTQSRETFYRLVQLFRASLSRLDESSRLTCLRSLIQRAITLDPSLLRILADDLLEILTRTYSRTSFNLLLQILAQAAPEGRSVHPQIHYTQIKIMELMEAKSLHPDRASFDALLKGSLASVERHKMIRLQMSRSGFSRKPVKVRHIARSLKLRDLEEPERTRILSLPGSAKSYEDRVNLLNCARGYIRDHHLWHTIVSKDRNSTRTIEMCLWLIKQGRLKMTAGLTSVLVKSCTSAARKTCLDQIVQLAVEKQVVFELRTWTDYLERLVWSGRYKEAVSIVVNEPGGNDFLDLPPSFRRSQTVWSMLVLHLNRLVTYDKCSPNKHARLLGKITTALDTFKIAFSPSLLECLLQAALLSGPRQWAARHSCDTVVACFQSSIDMGGEPWKIQPTLSMWQTYMVTLVANEEIALADKAMQSMINGGQLPDEDLLKTFALGIWESGSIEAIQRWQDYFDTECGEMSWPSQEETFSHRRTLNGPDGPLRYFYK